MSDSAAIASLFLGVVGLWMITSAWVSLRRIEGHSFQERALAMGLVLAPIFAALALLVLSLLLAFSVPMAFRTVTMVFGLALFLVCLIGGPWLLWALTRKSPSIQRLWQLAEQVRRKNLERA